jgi:hypothetical protein
MNVSSFCAEYPGYSRTKWSCECATGVHCFCWCQFDALAVSNASYMFMFFIEKKLLFCYVNLHSLCRLYLLASRKVANTFSRVSSFDPV